MDAYAALFPVPMLRRLFRLAVFAGLIFVFRHLLVLLVFFIAFQRPLGAASNWLQKRGVHRRLAIVGLALAFLGAIGTAFGLGLGRAFREGLLLRASLPAWFASFRDTAVYRSIEPHLHGAESLVDGAQHYATGAMHFVSEAGHILLYALIGFILAVVYLLEREELDDFIERLAPASLPGTLARWFGHLCDAISVTLQFQMIVALCNAVLTLPVLLLVGIPHAVAFFFMIFISGMVPVAGNFLAGAVLTFLAFQARGWVGVGVFVGLTFVLHKLESYYLNPRLASRHVHLPGLLLIVSLLLWEHLLGLVGLFISFPFLFIATRIRDEFRAADAPFPVAVVMPSAEPQKAIREG